MEKNFFKNIIILLIYLLLIFEPILGNTNSPFSNKDILELKNIIMNTLKKNNISNINELMEKIPSEILENSSIKIDSIFINDTNQNIILNENNIKCYDYFLSMEQELIKNINEFAPFKTLENMDMPEYCKNEYKKIYETISGIILTKLKNSGEFNKNLYFKNPLLDNNINQDKNNNVSNNRDKKKTKSYDDELEQYYIKSRKDCVEYGLKSSEEEIIVCTKYE